MPQKIYTCILEPNAGSREGGRVRIIFPGPSHGRGYDTPDLIELDDNSEAIANLSEIRIIGSGHYREEPGYFVALRGFNVQDRRKKKEDAGAVDPFRVEVESCTRADIVVRWWCERGAEIIKISLLIVGEV